jgi:hypothetical protein
VQRELARLEQSGLVTVRRIGTQKHYQANPESPLFTELCGIARKTVGLAEPLREALAPLASRIVAAFVYGSVAKEQDTESAIKKSSSPSNAREAMKMALDPTKAKNLLGMSS